jgi:hypothetical protein
MQEIESLKGRIERFEGAVAGAWLANLPRLLEGYDSTSLIRRDIMTVRSRQVQCAFIGAIGGHQ